MKKFKKIVFFVKKVFAKKFFLSKKNCKNGQETWEIKLSAPSQTLTCTIRNFRKSFQNAEKKPNFSEGPTPTKISRHEITGSG